MRTTFNYPEAGKNYSVTISIGEYANQRHMITLLGVDNEPFAVATVNMPEIHLEQDEVLIMDYSENEGMLDFLLTNDIVTLTDQVIESGYVRLYVCILNPEFVWGITQAYEEYQYEQHFNEY